MCNNTTAEDAKEACEKGAIPATKTACKDGRAGLNGGINREELGGLPGSPVVKNPLSSAGDMGSIPDKGLRSHMLWGNLSPCCTRKACMLQLEKAYLLQSRASAAKTNMSSTPR